MTKRERARVVELLRCAADARERGSRQLNGRYRAAEGLSIPDDLRAIAWNAFRQTSRGEVSDEGYRTELLEAALRVERGEWP
jgi:hypothetical protein